MDDSPTGTDAGRRTVRVLVVDDHRDSANAVVRLLQAEGYQAEAVYGYAETLARLRTGGHFDVIVTDIHLRDGDGVEMAGAFGDRVRAIAVSGSDEPAEMERARGAGFQEYLVKPFPITALLRAVGHG